MLQAVKKRHSTTSEALMVAGEMCAYCTVLTHFSSRYPKVQTLSTLDLCACWSCIVCAVLSM